IKWGIDAGHRRSLGLPEYEENTWRAGLDRLLLGYAMSGDGERMFGGILPFEGFESTRALVLGGLLDFTGQLFSRLEALKEPRSLGEWAACLAGMLDDFFEPGDDSEGELQRVRETLGRMAADASAAGFGKKVGLEVARHCLARRLEERVSAYGFITGGVTFCSMVPMRSIGFKVICLVGIDDEAFPRRSESAGFDLMVLDPRPGDPSRRNEDRYLFLEAVLSAREKLHVSYVGRSDQDNSSIPPSVVVSELLDYVERGFSHPSKEILGHVVTRHRLQPFHPDYFSGATGLFSYSAENCRAAARSLRPRDPAGEFIPSSLPAPGEEWDTVEVEDLCAFLVNPARFLLTRRLGIYLEEAYKAPEDREAFSLVQLERYRLKDELAAKGLRGLDPMAFYGPARAAGRLPHGAVGRYFYRLTSEEVEKFLDGVREFRSLEPLAPLEVDLDLDGCRVVGRLIEIYPEALLRFRPGAVKPADRLRTWVSHLLLGALRPEGYPGTSIFSGHDLQCRYSPVEDCGQVLAGLVRCYRQGLTRPWKLFPTASWKFAKAVVTQQRPEDTALHQALADWQGGDYSRGDCDDPYLELCFGRAGPPLDREFCQAALEVYRPLLEHQQETRL
ncbi:MAG: exodeoxyribonuclease V subunit gamma, partial [Candidatus Glassbacteria bacterium]|nr:exodeoxyribonuclease V subunit gamma [Candidatus Glassbacteria bacterium]